MIYEENKLLKAAAAAQENILFFTLPHKTLKLYLCFSYGIIKNINE